MQRTDLSGKSKDFVDGYRLGYQKGRQCKTKYDKRRGNLTDISKLKWGHWEYSLLFENEEQRDDWDIQCSECGALICCDGEEQAQQQKEMSKYCYNCGAEMNKFENKEG